MTTATGQVNRALFRRYGHISLSLGSGVLLAQALAPVHFLWGVPPALAVAMTLLLRQTSWRGGALVGWLLGLAYFGTGLSWIVEPFQVDPDRHAWMAPFALVFLAAGLALFWGAAFGLAARCTGALWRCLALILAWSLAEYARAYVLTGLPWAAFGQFWIDTPAAHLLPWIGPQGLALATLGATLPLALLRRHPLVSLLPAGVVAAVVALLPAPPERPAMTDKIVRIVQPNAPQHLKWDPDHKWGFVRRALSYTAAEPAPDLVVWPETAVPQLMNYALDTLQVVADTAAGVPMVLGIQREQDGQYFNSLITLDGDGGLDQTYDKAHLVPFGEYVPFGNLMARFGIHGFASQAGQGYAAGPGPQVLDLGIGTAVPLICYEAVFPELANGVQTRAEMLIQITNDAWFGTYSGPFQHLVQARMRAAEQGLPMIRAANTGVSGMIDPHGRMLQMLPLGEAGYVDAALPLPLPPTLYSRTGDGPLFLVLLLAGLFVALWHRRYTSRS